MKAAKVKEFLEECIDKNGNYDEQELIDLVLWAFDEGWEKGREDLREEIYL